MTNLDARQATGPTKGKRIKEVANGSYLAAAAHPVKAPAKNDSVPPVTLLARPKRFELLTPRFVV
jgi:hypothetical protein